MEKQGSGSLELQCVGKLEIARPKPVRFVCGSIPVTTDESFHDFSSAALIPSPNTVSAPRYRMIPTETDLNALPLLSSIPERVLPIAATQLRANGDSSWQGGPITSSLARKGEALAVTGLAEYGDEIDVIAPADILKQIFKIPYSKARVSVAVRRVGQTLILNSGPDIEEGEKLIQRQNHQPKCVDQSLFLNFAMHSVRMEACDCPPSHNTSSEEQCKSSICTEEGSVSSSNHPIQGHHAPDRQREGIVQGDKYAHQEEFPTDGQDNLFWGKKKNKRYKGSEALKKVSEVKEKPRGPVQESEKYRKTGANDFLRILFWQFHNFRMLLGSDLLIFSNEKFAAVSLHLWDVSRKVTPLTWLEAWLDNFIASVPELAICYHENGVVQGYELLKTDDIFLLKGVSDDGAPAFHPHVVQQNGLSVMRFLHENCKQDPGAYWLHKSAGEDFIQLFDLSVIPKNHCADDCHDDSSSLPALIYRGRSDSVLSLGTLLYRIAHRLSLSMSSNNRARCASFFQKCLSFLDEPDHLVVRALAHEQFARLLLTYNEEIELTSAMPPVESEVIISDAEEESYDLVSGFSASSIQDFVNPPISAVEIPENKGYLQHAELEKSPQMSFGLDIPSPGMPDLVDLAVRNKNVSNVDSNDSAVSNLLKKTDDLVQTVSDPLSSKLAAIHHVSQAIKSLRWTRQLQTDRKDLNLENEVEDDPTSSVDFSVCACGDTDCIEICDIREWLPTSKIDDKLWKLVLLLGESYLSLGQVYKDDGQLFQALKVVELACLVYGSMPKDTEFISSMMCSSLIWPDDRTENMTAAMHGDVLLPSNYLFWAKAWTLVGDIYVDFYLMKGQEISSQHERKECTKKLKISSEVLKEVVRLKKKIGQFNENCSSCSLVNCSCQSDRASSGSSASSSARGTYSSTYGRKQSKKPYSKNILSAHTGDYNDHSSRKEGLKDTCGTEQKKHHKSNSCDDNRNVNFRVSDAMKEMNLTACSVTAEVSKEKDDARSAEETLSETTSKENFAVKSGGIFKFLRGSLSGDADSKLSVAVNCYKEALKAMGGLPPASTELQSVLKKKGWACNELGRNMIEMKDLDKAETAFANAIDAFRQVEDHTNIILINCNLGHGRRALAEDMVSKVESLKKHAICQNARIQALETAKVQYSEALRYYGTAKMELIAFVEKVDPLSSSLKTEVNTQFAHTYLKLGMLLASENTVAEVYENGVREDCLSSRSSQTQSEKRKHEISANDAIREALAVYESLGEVRRQEAAYAHFQLACYHRDCILRFMDSDKKNNNISKVDSSLVQKVKQYAALAERNWQKSADFYGPKSHPVMFLTILIDRSALSFSLSTYLHSSTMLESALTHLLEGRHAFENTSLRDQTHEVYAKFWSQIQTVLKSMVTTARSKKANKYPQSPQQNPGKSSDFKKLSELYKISLKSPDFSQLHKMHSFWTGNHSQ